MATTAQQGFAAPRVPDLSGAPWFAISATLFAGVMPALLIGGSDLNANTSDAWPGALAIVIVAGLRYSWLLAAKAERIGELVFWLFTYVFFGLAPLVQMRLGEYPSTTPRIHPGYNWESLIVVMVGVVGFSLGIILAGRPRSVERRESRLLVHRVYMLTAFAILAAGYYIAKVGVGALLTTRESVGLAEKAAFGDPTTVVIYRAFAIWPLLVSFVALLALARERRKVGGRRPFILLLITGALLALDVNPLGSARYVFGTALLAVLYSIFGLPKPRRLRIFALVFALALVLVFPFADIARYNNGTGNAQKEGGFTLALTSADFDALDEVNNTVLCTTENGHTDGKQLLGAALFFVPRSTWPTKPIDTGIFLANCRGYIFTNLSAPIWAELFIDGGFPLLLLGMLALGFLVRRSDLAGQRDRGLASTSKLLAWTTPFYLLLMLRGSLLQSMAGFLTIILLGLFVTRSVRRPASAAT